MWLRTMTEDVERRGFMPALVSLRHLADDPNVPVASPFTILLHPELTYSCCVSPHPTGTSGAELARERPQEVLAEMGRILGHLEGTVVPYFGRLASRRTFHPERDTWEDEWRVHIERALHRCRSKSVAPVKLLDRLEEQLFDHLPALREVNRWSQVHGNLSPFHMRFVQAGTDYKLSSLLGWERSLWGDALVEWGPLLHLNARHLNGIIEGYGKDRAAELLEPSCAARLHVYRLSHALSFLRESAHVPIEGRATARAQAFLMLESSLQPNATEHHLAAALRGDAPMRRPHPPQTLSVIFAALDRLQHLPVMPPDRLALWGVVASTALLAHEVPLRTTQQGYQAIATRLIVPLKSESEPHLGHTDLRATLQVQTERIVGALAASRQPIGNCPTLCLLARVTEAAQAVGALLPPAVGSGLRSSIEVRWAQEVLIRKSPAQTMTALAQGLLGRAALLTLSRAFPEISMMERVGGKLRGQVTEGWGVLGEMGPIQED
ncbi:MAG: hypothetical protein GWP91_10955 [Rhodobacterales bacterium]|nr:hypothetical protein [Rhodobacterales bacterium]